MNIQDYTSIVSDLIFVNLCADGLDGIGPDMEKNEPLTKTDIFLTVVGFSGILVSIGMKLLNKRF